MAVVARQRKKENIQKGKVQILSSRNESGEEESRAMLD